jgi:carbohydrate esterase-like sialic acid-specific acetylesterase
MKKYIITIIVFACSISAKAQFSNTDTLRAFINHWIRNSAVEAFQNLRLNTALIGTTNFIDSAYGGQVKNFYAINDTTAKLVTILNDTFTVVLKTKATQLTDSSFKVGNDTITIHGTGGGGGYTYAATAPTGLDTLKYWIKTPDFCGVYDVFSYITTFGWQRWGWLSIDGVLTQKKPINIGFSGQSNMAGNFPGGDTARFPGLIGYTSGGQNGGIDDPTAWEPVYIGKSPFFLTNNNIAFQVAKRIKKNGDADIIRVIGAYRGATNLAAWINTGADYMLDTLRNRLSRSGIDTLDLFIWHQGESGGLTGETVGGYVVDQRTLYDSLCSPLTQGFKRNWTKYIAGGLGNDTLESVVYNIGSPSGGQQVLNWDGNLNTAWVPAWGLHTGDGIHFTATSLDSMGYRYYTQFKSLPHSPFEERPLYNFDETYDGYKAYDIPLTPYTGGGAVYKILKNSLAWKTAGGGYPYLTINLSTGGIDVGDANSLGYPDVKALRVSGQAIVSSGSGNMIVSGNFNNTGTVEYSTILGNYGNNWNLSNGVSNSVLIGNDAGYNGSKVPYNSTITGMQAGYNYGPGGFGDYLSIYGRSAGSGGGGKYAAFFGAFAGAGVSGDYVTSVGYAAGAANTNVYANSSSFGANAQFDSSNQIVLGDTSISQLKVGKFRWKINSTPSNGDAFKYNSSTGIFELGATGGLSGSGTSGRIAYWNGSSSLTSSSNFLFSTTGPAFSVGTTNTQGVLNLGGNKDLSSSGVQSYFAGATYTDQSTSSGGTSSSFDINYIAAPTIAAANTSVTFPAISTLGIDAPSTGSNATITKKYALTLNGTGANLGMNGFIEGAYQIRSSAASGATIAAGAGSGTGASGSVSGNDMAGKIDITTGSSPSTSATIVTITFNAAYSSAPTVILTPGNAASAALTGGTQVFVSSTSTTNFVVLSGSTALGASTQYIWYYHVIQ